MVEFETLSAVEQKFGANNFIEVAKKKAITEKGENEFIAVSRGFYGQDGSKRFTKSMSIPNEVIDFVAEKLKEMKSAAAEAPAPAPSEAPAPGPEEAPPAPE
ncbi:MAG: hypothetical protein ISS95_00115 [Candidatus Aenigmarchaeota archaeon]|nr:hypothetical protein [Candidatus Aenigmarchaeota archaeon]